MLPAGHADPLFGGAYWRSVITVINCMFTRRPRERQDAMKLQRRQFLHVTACAVALPAVSRIARAQAYPTRSVRLVVGFPPGQTADLIARLMGQSLTERLGQPVIIDSRPGASSNIATDMVCEHQGGVRSAAFSSSNHICIRLAL